MDRFENDGLVFEVIDAAPSGITATDGETAVLLHGYPQTPHAWSDVIPLLSAGGVRCLAPALRGFTAGAMPEGRRAYRTERLVADALALLDTAGIDRAHIVGHDWGGGIAWLLATQHPDRVRTLTSIATPHPAAARWASLRSRQGLMSWYMLAMQIPALPEAVLGWGLKRNGLASLGLPEHHERAYLRWLRHPGALRSTLGVYRGLLTRPAGAYFADNPVTVPTTYLWGNRDAYLGRVAAEATERYCQGPYRFVEIDADHWLPEKHPERVAEEILTTIRSTDPA
ncbi:alpha/beta fold hydrolase [Granulicoccus sp. GXG6511]|uniref:alpha/beta fold hydrolase n=1 Tax=Granulicoccus sp. GXG6511 TaxID=3381351 RepID=UPI003D7C9724